MDISLVALNEVGGLLGAYTAFPTQGQEEKLHPSKETLIFHPRTTEQVVSTSPHAWVTFLTVVDSYVLCTDAIM